MRTCAGLAVWLRHAQYCHHEARLNPRVRSFVLHSVTAQIKTLIEDCIGIQFWLLMQCACSWIALFQVNLALWELTEKKKYHFSIIEIYNSPPLARHRQPNTKCSNKYFCRGAVQELGYVSKISVIIKSLPSGTYNTVVFMRTYYMVTETTWTFVYKEVVICNLCRIKIFLWFPRDLLMFYQAFGVNCSVTDIVSLLLEGHVHLIKYFTSIKMNTVSVNISRELFLKDE